MKHLILIVKNNILSRKIKKFLTFLLLVTTIVAIIALTTNHVAATDCNSNCEKHFDSWYRKPDLKRCQTERKIACKTGLQTCDIWRGNHYYEPIKRTLQESHNRTGYPESFSQCDEWASTGFLIESGLSHISNLPSYAEKLENFLSGAADSGSIDWITNITSLGAVEVAKSLARCSCNGVNWSVSSAPLLSDTSASVSPNATASKTSPETEFIDTVDIPISQLGTPGSFEERFRAVNDWAVSNGYAAGFPNFHQADYGNGVVYGTVLIKK